MYGAFLRLMSLSLLESPVLKPMIQWDLQLTCTDGEPLILDNVVADVSSQLADQSRLGVKITQASDVPGVGPAHRGLWQRIPGVSAVFADLKSSTELSASHSRKETALAYTYFIRAMAVVLEGFDAKYVDIQGDGIFGLFSGKNSTFLAAACAITMRTQVEKEVASRYGQDTSTDWKLAAGVGIDHGTLLVRRLGLRGAKQNEVWAGKAVNMAAKLSSLAEPNQVAVSDRVFNQYGRASRLRQRALIWSCGCDGDARGGGLDVAMGETACLWDKKPASKRLGLDFQHYHGLCSAWCVRHGSEFCETIVTGSRS